MLNMNGKTIAISARAPDALAGSPASILVDGVPAFPEDQAKELNVCVINEVTGMRLECVGYNLVGQPGEEVLLAQFIERILPGRIVVVTCRGMLVSFLRPRTRRAFSTLGSQSAWARETTDSWVLIGAKGLATGVGKDVLSPDAAQITSNIPLLDEDANGIVIDASYSPTGQYIGIFRIEGSHHNELSQVQSGSIALAWVDADGTASFSRLEMSNPGTSQWIVDKISECPDDRTIGIIAPVGTAAALSASAKAALSAIGSNLIETLAPSESWCFIATKGLIGRPAAEAKAGGGMPLNVRHWAFPKQTGLGRFAISVSSASHDMGNHSRTALDGAGLHPLSDYPRGVNVRVLHEGDGLVCDGRVFDTWGDPNAAEALADFIERLPAGRIATVGIMDDGGGALNDRARNALASLGAGLSFEVGTRHAYALIGVKGAAPASVPELLSSTGPIELLCHLPASISTRGFVTVEVSVANSERDGISLDGEKVLGAFRGYGVRAALINSAGQVLKTFEYDDVLDAAKADELAALVEQVHEDSVVALAALGSRRFVITDRLRTALRACGSSVPEAEAWSLVGRKNFDAGGVAEVGSLSGSASVRSDIPRTDSRPTGLNVDLFSATHDFGNSVHMAVNGISIETAKDYGRGIRLAVIDQQDGSVLQTGSFDTYESAAEADRLAEVIERLPAGQIVLMAVMDNATGNLTDRARRAIRSCGSQLIGQMGDRGSWCIAGYKGAPPGSVAERLNNRGPVAMECWFPDGRSNGPWLALVAVVVVIIAVVIALAVMRSAIQQSKKKPVIVKGNRRVLFIAFAYGGHPSSRLGREPLRRCQAVGRVLGIGEHGYSWKEIDFLSDVRSEPTATEVLAHIEKFYEGAQPGDCRTLYFFGHGWSGQWDGEFQRRLNIPKGAVMDWILSKQIRPMIEKLPKGVRVEVFTHACYSGGFIDAAQIGKTNWVHLAATSEKDFAYSPKESQWWRDFTLTIHEYICQANAGQTSWPTFEYINTKLEEANEAGYIAVLPELNIGGGFNTETPIFGGYRR